MNGNANVASVESIAAGDATLSGTISGAGRVSVTTGKMTLTNNSNSYTGTTTVDGGTLLVNGSHSGGDIYTVNSGGTLGGTGSIGSTILINSGGILAPGASVGTLTTTTNVTMAAGSHLAIELSGASADKLVVGGGLDLSGAQFLDVTGIGSGSSWLIATYAGSLTGTFESVTPGYTVDYGTAGQITLNLGGLAGDYNGNNKVDAADYVLWRKNPTGFGGNPAGYTTWRQNFGQPPGSGAGLASSAGVPEPASCSLVLCAVLGLLSGCSRRGVRAAA
jgi:autotransporter-associated beta strand protein